MCRGHWLTQEPFRKSRIKGEAGLAQALLTSDDFSLECVFCALIEGLTVGATPASAGPGHQLFPPFPQPRMPLAKSDIQQTLDVIPTVALFVTWGQPGRWARHPHPMPGTCPSREP